MPSRIAARSTTAGTPVKSCEQHARRRERDLLLRRALDVPARQRFDVGGLDEAAVLVAEQVLEQDFQRKRQPGDFGKPARCKRRRLNIWYVRPPTARGVRVPKLFTVDIESILEKAQIELPGSTRARPPDRCDQATLTCTIVRDHAQTTRTITYAAS